MANIKQTVKLGVFTLAIMNVTAVVSLRGLPAEAVYGMSSAFYYLFAAIVFLIPTSLVAAELAAMFQEELYDELDGPVARIAALDVPMPYNIRMEKHSIPDVERICASIRAMF